jgi:ssDNA-binding Zn-finger/Zn-ribbon topoisomerase 1
MSTTIITETEAKKNKEAYKEIKAYYQGKKIQWSYMVCQSVEACSPFDFQPPKKYKTAEAEYNAEVANSLSVTLVGKVGRGKKLFYLDNVPELIKNEYIKRIQESNDKKKQFDNLSPREKQAVIVGNIKGLSKYSGFAIFTAQQTRK